MKMDPRVEVMIRYYYMNAELMEYELSRAIGSVNHQTYPNLLVTFCRDGGLDAHELIKETCVKEWRSMGGQVNMGRGFTTNCLLSAAAGDFFCLLDSDDYMEPCYIERCMEVSGEPGTVMIKPKVKLVYFYAKREDIKLFELYFDRFIDNGDEFYRGIFGPASIKVFGEGLQMISKVFHRCMVSLRTRSDMNITEDCYWMYKANRIVRDAGLKQKTLDCGPGGYYVQVHPMNRMERYEVLGLKMKAEDYYEMPTEEEVQKVKEAYGNPKGL